MAEAEATLRLLAEAARADLEARDRARKRSGGARVPV
jgi:hypothetical protein